MDKQIAKVPEHAIEKVSEHAKFLELRSPEIYRLACARLLTVKRLIKEVQDTFSPIKNKTHAAWKESVAQEKKYLSELQEAEKTLREKINDYASREDDLETPDISYRNDWRFKVVNEELVPREFLEVDESRIRERVKSLGPVAQIPGVEVWQEKTVVASAGALLESAINTY